MNARARERDCTRGVVPRVPARARVQNPTDADLCGASSRIWLILESASSMPPSMPALRDRSRLVRSLTLASKVSFVLESPTRSIGLLESHRPRAFVPTAPLCVHSVSILPLDTLVSRCLVRSRQSAARTGAAPKSAAPNPRASTLAPPPIPRRARRSAAATSRAARRRGRPRPGTATLPTLETYEARLALAHVTCYP